MKRLIQVSLASTLMVVFTMMRMMFFILSRYLDMRVLLPSL